MFKKLHQGSGQRERKARELAAYITQGYCKDFGVFFISGMERLWGF